jgi:hypothetical protein
MFKWIKRLHKTQPPENKRKVIELKIGGRIGRWMRNANWGAMTIPWSFFTTIWYWETADEPDDSDVNPLIRVHEFVHVAQNEHDLFFGVSWVRYMWESVRHFSFKQWRAEGFRAAMMAAYHANRFELEAYEIGADAAEYGVPDWA